MFRLIFTLIMTLFVGMVRNLKKSVILEEDNFRLLTRICVHDEN